MEEKIITGHKNGMLVLLLELVLYIAAVVFLIVGINAGLLPLVVLCVILLSLGWIPLCGLRVLKPQEALVLTLFGILLGCFMGHWLHIYLVRSTEIDLMMFGRQTAPSAYVYAAILTALFSLLVNVLAHFKMKKIDMVESLKSSE